jgi:OOP family OmpA-OmpF porin
MIIPPVMRRIGSVATVTLSGALLLVLEGIGWADDERQAQPHTFEIGAYGGVFLPSDRHELFDARVGHTELDDIGPTVGLRLGYLPVRFFGLEAEAGWVPIGLAEGSDEEANLINVRGHLVAQWPGLRVSPLLVGGGGQTLLRSGPDALGNDEDLSVYYGVGLKAFVAKRWALRLDFRHLFAPAFEPLPDDSDLTQHFEVLVGLSHLLRASKPDRDKDGIPDETDRCPDEPGVAPSGCPDRDGDGIIDRQDACPDAAGDAPHGCPDSDGDRVHDGIDQCPQEAGRLEDGCPDQDGDGFIDRVDRCPTEPGVAPDGCPDLDPDKDGVEVPSDQCPDEPGIPPDGCPDVDGDGFTTSVDQCPDEPETTNGFEDTDGCPDELPQQVAKFVGTIEGIRFANGRARIQRRSLAVLNRAARILEEYPELRVEIEGHTDSTGRASFNLRLSQARAERVRKYLIRQGVEPDRLVARGYGAERPIAPNNTRVGRAKNRRIEFRLLSGNE